MNLIVQKTNLGFPMEALHIGPLIIKIVGDKRRGKNNENF